MAHIFNLNVVGCVVHELLVSYIAIQLYISLAFVEQVLNETGKT